MFLVVLFFLDLAARRPLLFPFVLLLIGFFALARVLFFLTALAVDGEEEKVLTNPVLAEDCSISVFGSKPPPFCIECFFLICLRK